MSTLRKCIHSMALFWIGMYVGANLNITRYYADWSWFQEDVNSNNNNVNMQQQQHIMDHDHPIFPLGDGGNQTSLTLLQQRRRRRQRQRRTNHQFRDDEPAFASDYDNNYYNNNEQDGVASGIDGEKNDLSSFSSSLISFDQCFSQLQSLRQQLNHCHNQLQQLFNDRNVPVSPRNRQESFLSSSSSSSSTMETETSSSSSFPNDSFPPQQTQQQQHPVCRSLASSSSSTTIPTAMSLWTNHLRYIHPASQLPNDSKLYMFSDFTAELLHLVTNRLPRAVKTVPHRWDSVERVLTIGYERWKYVMQVKQQQQQPQETTGQRQRQTRRRDETTTTTTSTDSAAPIPIPRKLNILIMGGSLLVGTNCRKIVSDVGFPNINIPNRHCTWSNRLEKFLNQILWSIGINVMTRMTRNNPDNITSSSSSSFQWSWDAKERDFHNVDWEDVIHVTKTAMGGTNTQTGKVILEYDLLPPEARHPDIIINAYSTNDMHILTALDAANANITLRDKLLDMIQGFVRQVLARRQPPATTSCTNHTTGHDDDDDRPVPPLLLHMDDYLGNEQREIWATTELSQSVQVLANYYGFTSMSYADVVRDLVYGDTHESWFSPKGWYEDDTNNNNNSDKKQQQDSKMQREIHPGMGMHITATWVTAYTMLHLITTYCSLEWTLAADIHNNNNNNNKSSLASWNDDHRPFDYEHDQRHNDIWATQLPPLKRKFPSVPGKPKRPPRDLLPPLLTKTLSLENITHLWRHPSHALYLDWSSSSSSSSLSSCQSGDTATSNMAVRCPFSWVSGLSLQQNDATNVEDYFGQRTIRNEGWKLNKDHNKLGFVPQNTSSIMILEFFPPPTTSSTNNVAVSSLQQPPQQQQQQQHAIRTITFFIMKSYGPRWANSRVQVTIIRQREDNHNNNHNEVEEEDSATFTDVSQQIVLEGFHDKQTSEMYTEPLWLDQPIPITSTFRIQMELISGETFKLMGLAVCR